jgi:DNA-binding XRE family transcriptional regulator
MVSKAVPPEREQKGIMKLIEASEFRVARERQGLSVEEAAQICDVNPRTAYRYEKQSAPASLVQKLNASSDTSIGAASDTWFKFIDLFAGIGGLGHVSSHRNGMLIVAKHMRLTSR